MPRNVRNWWVTLANHNSGPKTTHATGPTRAAGGIEVIIKQRNLGEVTTALTIEGHTMPDGRLVLRVFDSRGKVILNHQTHR